MKIYYPGGLEVTVTPLAAVAKAVRVGDVSQLDRGPEHHPLVVFKAKWPGDQDSLAYFLRKASAW